MVEHAAVNRDVVGSSPTSGATICAADWKMVHVTITSMLRDSVNFRGGAGLVGEQSLSHAAIVSDSAASIRAQRQNRSCRR